MPGPEAPTWHSKWWLSRSSFALSLLAVSAVIALRLFPLQNELRQSPHLHYIIEAAIPRSEPRRPPAGLIILSQRGVTNDPLPTGITLTSGSGGETVTLQGLRDGFELSLGTSQG